MVNIPKAAAFSNCYTVQPVRRISGDFLPGNDPVFAAVLKTSDNGIIDFLKFHGVDLLKMFCVLVFRDDPRRGSFRPVTIRPSSGGLNGWDHIGIGTGGTGKVCASVHPADIVKSHGLFRALPVWFPVKIPRRFIVGPLKTERL